VAETIFLEIFV